MAGLKPIRTTQVLTPLHLIIFLQDIINYVSNCQESQATATW